MKRVVILQYRLLHYRIELFSLMRAILAARGIELVLVHGQASASEKLRDDEDHLPWAIRVVNRFWRIKGKDLLWQPLPVQARGAALYIVMQENRILSNYLLQLRRCLGTTKVAYWGHGRNFQTKAPSGLRERWKSYLLSKVDWWFAYTDLSVEHLARHGYPLEHITNLQNAIDVRGFQRQLNSVTRLDLSNAAKQLGLSPQSRVGIFCGSLYAEKRTDLLLASADLTRKAIPDFHLIVIGEGPDMVDLRAAAETRKWVHCMGMRRGYEKAVLFRLAHIEINPGLVGLHVLDSFAAGVPMVTTATASHSPEISYLRNGINGVIAERDDPEGYSLALIALLNDEARRESMTSRCLADAQNFTVEKMAHNFCDGIVHCLESHGPRPVTDGDSGNSTGRLAM